MSDIDQSLQTRPLRLGDPAPRFSARTTQGPITLEQYAGSWVILFSHPADFTPVCTSEFMALAMASPRFAKLDCALLGLSVDSLYAHIAWIKAIRDGFGIKIGFPVIEDPSMTIARAYGMLDAAAHHSGTVRGTYFIDPDGIIRAIIWYPMNVGRSVDEMLRLLTALQQTDTTGLMTPEGWQPGAPFLTALPQPSEALLNEASAQWFCSTKGVE